MSSTSCITVPLGQDAHRFAERFAAEQATPTKGKQVYLNTLAVYAVRSYLDWLAVPTRLDESDCWQPGTRALFNVADLVLPKVGKLECRSLLPGETTLHIPPEVSDRIGYVAVQFSQSLDSVDLLGFAPSSERLEIPISTLRSLDDLLETIAHYETLTQFRQWFEGIFEDWRSPETLLAEAFRSSSPAFRSPASSVSRAKVLNLAEIAVILVVQLSPAEDDLLVSLRLYPTQPLDHLPENLQFKVIDAAGMTCLETQARSQDDWMQLDVQGHAGERFDIQVVLDGAIATEKFVI